MDIRDILKARDAQYAEAWRKTGPMAKPVIQELGLLLLTFPEVWYNWVIILNKLARILGDPKNIDSWRDIAGYATLVVDFLEKRKESK